MKKIILFVLSLFIFTFNVKASDEITIYIFHGDGCGFCENALSFLRPYAAESKNVKLVGKNLGTTFIPLACTNPNV